MKLMIAYLVIFTITTLILRLFTNDRRNITLGILWPILVLMVVSGIVFEACNLLVSFILDETEGVKNE